MSRGKYSPAWVNKDCIYNCYGKIPEPWCENYNEKTMFANYDNEGFDRYGYSCFDSEGNYVGIGNGIDRLGYTEYEYLTMDDDTWNSL